MTFKHYQNVLNEKSEEICSTVSLSTKTRIVYIKRYNVRCAQNMKSINPYFQPLNYLNVEI